MFIKLTGRRRAYYINSSNITAFYKMDEHETADNETEVRILGADWLVFVKETPEEILAMMSPDPVRQSAVDAQAAALGAIYGTRLRKSTEGEE